MSAVTPSRSPRTEKPARAAASQRKLRDREQAPRKGSTQDHQRIHKCIGFLSREEPEEYQAAYTGYLIFYDIKRQCKWKNSKHGLKK